jgi:hypothetical protein
MLAQRRIMEAAGLQFDKNANYETIWTLGGRGPLVGSR